MGHPSALHAQDATLAAPPVVLRPGLASLALWRGLYRGAPLFLDPVARADVEAGATGLRLIRQRGEAIAPREPAEPSPAHDGMRGEPAPLAVARLIVGLKLASLGQGATGARWALVRLIADCLASNLLPVLAEPSAANGDALKPFAELLAGRGQARLDGAGLDAGEAFVRAGVSAIETDADEWLALVSGSQAETGFALAGLFEAERVLHAGLVAASLAEAARGVPPGPLPRIVSRLLRHPGKADVTAALAALRANRAVNADEPAGQPVARLQLGASLDLLSLAGTILERQANAVTEERLVVWQTDEIVDGLADRSSIRMAADLVSLALCEASRLSVARIGECAKEAGGGGASAGRAMAASFLAELEARALPAAFRPDEAGEAAPSDVPRLLPLAGTAALIVAIDAVSAARALDRARPEPLGAPLDAVRRLVRERVPAGTGADFGLTDLAAAADLVRSGALADAAGLEMPLAGGEIDRLRPRSR